MLSRPGACIAVAVVEGARLLMQQCEIGCKTLRLKPATSVKGSAELRSGGSRDGQPTAAPPDGNDDGNSSIAASALAAGIARGGRAPASGGVACPRARSLALQGPVRDTAEMQPRYSRSLSIRISARSRRDLGAISREHTCCSPLCWSLSSPIVRSVSLTCRDTAEMQPRYSRDAAEMQPRYLLAEQRGVLLGRLLRARLRRAHFELRVAPQVGERLPRARRVLAQ